MPIEQIRVPIDVATSPDGEPVALLTSRINMFVGANNVGKSRILRRLYAMRELEFRPSRQTIDQLNELQQQFSAAVLRHLRTARIHNLGTISDAAELPKVEFLTTTGRELSPFRSALASAIALGEHRKEYAGVRSETAAMLRQCGETFQNRLNEAEKAIPSVKRVYIPSLRGLRVLDSDRDLYSRITVSAYFNDDDGDIGEHARDHVITGQTFVRLARSALLGASAQRDMFTSYLESLSRTFFEGRRVEIVPHEESGALLVRIAGDGEWRVEQLGDGMQQIILLSFVLFMNRDVDLLLFVEEPEIYLHPGLQRLLLTTLGGGEFPRAQLFMTTHSNHLLDISMPAVEPALFRVRKRRDARPPELVQVAREDVSLMQDLGVTNGSVLLSNCTIWVEGICDRLYLRHYLDLLQRSDPAIPTFAEDIHYSFFEYGGSNLSHFDLIGVDGGGISAMRLCGRLLLIADRDQGKERKHEALREILGDRYEVLPVREVENLLTPAVLIAVLTERERGSDNIRIDFIQDDYRDEYLGAFIEQRILKDYRRSTRIRSKRADPHPYASDSGTIHGKVDFAKSAISMMTSFADLSLEAQALTRRVHAFIVENNGSTAAG